MAVGQFPDICQSGGRIAPKHIASAVVIVITSPGDPPTGPRVRAQIDAVGPMAVYDLPFVDIAGVGIKPQHIARSIAVEVPHTGDLIAERMRPGLELAAHLPARSSQISVAPVPGLNHTTPLLPPPLKSPTPAIWSRYRDMLRSRRSSSMHHF